jgi:hypothetical protein
MRTLIRSLALLAIFAACNPGDDDLPVPTSWTALGQHAKEALLSVSGRSERDVFAVGADRGAGPLVLHYDGETWQRMSTGSRGDLWWVHAFADGPVFMAGAYATILKHEGDTFTRMKTPGIGVNTIYGLWGPAPDDLYAVGSITGRNGFIWHYDGKEWKDLPLPDDLPAHRQARHSRLLQGVGPERRQRLRRGRQGRDAARQRPRRLQGRPHRRRRLALHRARRRPRGHRRRRRPDRRGSSRARARSSTPSTPTTPWSRACASSRAWSSPAASWAPSTSAPPTAPGRSSTPASRSTSSPCTPCGSTPRAACGPSAATSSPAARATAASSTAAKVYPRSTPPSSPTPTPRRPPRSAPRAARTSRPTAASRAAGTSCCSTASAATSPSRACTPATCITRAWRSTTPGPPTTPPPTAWSTPSARSPTTSRAAREIAMSHAAYRLMKHRYGAANGGPISVSCYDTFMATLGLDPADQHTEGDDPVAVGNRIGRRSSPTRLDDGANEAANYADTTGYAPTNPPLVVDRPGTGLADPNEWQSSTSPRPRPRTASSSPRRAATSAQLGLGRTPFALTPDERRRPSTTTRARAEDGGPREMNEWVLEVLASTASSTRRPAWTIDISPGPTATTRSAPTTGRATR